MLFTAAEIVDIVQKLSIAVVIVLVLLGVLWLLVRTFTSGQERFGRMSETNQAELVQLRRDYKQITKEKFDLEVKFTICREALARLQERIGVDLSDAKKQEAINKLLEDTQDLDRELLLLNKAMKDKDEIIRDKDEIIQLLEKRLQGLDPNA